jgi:hypothetical protein
MTDTAGPTGGKPDNHSQVEQRLFEDLRAAAYVHETENQYLGAAYACAAVAQFIRRKGQGAELAIPFIETAEAFRALDKGQKPTLFLKRSEREKERPHSPERQRLKRIAAAMLEVLVTIGNETRESAAQRIARYAQHWRGMGTETISGKTIIAWRKQLSAQEDAEYLAVVKATLEEKDPIAKVNHYLERLQSPPKR